MQLKYFTPIKTINVYAAVFTPFGKEKIKNRFSQHVFFLFFLLNLIVMYIARMNKIAHEYVIYTRNTTTNNQLKSYFTFFKSKNFENGLKLNQLKKFLHFAH